MLRSWLGLRSMGSPSASLRPLPPCATNERGLAPQREQRPESDLPSADAETYMLVGLSFSTRQGRTRAWMKPGIRCRAGRWHRGRFRTDAESSCLSWTGSPASTPYCEAGLSGERAQ